jgi:predicted DNA-binding transcriptional regulator AlpA
MALEDILDVPTVSKLLCISETAVHRLTHRKTIPYQWIAGRKVFKKSDIDAYLADAAKQARRRGGSGQQNLFLGDVAVGLDETLAALKAQAPNGFDPASRKRGAGK